MLLKILPVLQLFRGRNYQHYLGFTQEAKVETGE